MKNLILFEIVLVILYIWIYNYFIKDEAQIYEDKWVHGSTYIHRTVGNRGQDEFNSSLCPDYAYDPEYISSSEYIARDRSYIFKLNNNTLVIDSTDQCLPTGTYLHVK